MTSIASGMPTNCTNFSLDVGLRVDVFGGMMSPRVVRPKEPHNQVAEHLEEGAEHQRPAMVFLMPTRFLRPNGGLE